MDSKVAADPYAQDFNVTAYDGTTVVTNMAQLDQNAWWQAQLSCTYAICFGCCIMALLHLVALTPAAKRRLPLFTFNVAALLFEIIRLINGIYFTTHSGFTRQIQFLGLGPPMAGISRGDIANSACGAIAAWPAFICIQVCFYIQAKSVLASMRRLFYWLIMGYLLFCGGFAAGWRLVQAIWNFGNAIGKFSASPWELQNGSLVLYSISIGSWSLVFAGKVGYTVWTRSKMGIRRSDAMNILLMTSIESMLIPGKLSPVFSYFANPLTL